MSVDPESSRKMIAGSEFIKYLGIELLELDETKAKGRMPFSEKACNPFGTMHGGSLYALADTIAGTLADPTGKDVVTVDGSLKFLEAAYNTRYVYCDAAIIRRGKHLTTVEVSITGDDGRLLDCGLFSFFRKG